MKTSVIAWSSAAYVAAFWLFFLVRIGLMRGRGISVLTIAPRRPVLNVLGVLGFFGILAAWSGVLAYLAFRPSGFVLFRPLWSRSTEYGSALVWAGGVLAVAGQLFMWAAILTMGRAWRVGIDDGSPGELVTRGVFRISRNPIFLGMDVAAAGAFLVQPNPFLLACAVFAIVGFHLQIRGEERHLERTYGDSYLRYRERTARYFLFL